MARIALTRLFLISILMIISAGATADVLLIQQVRQAGRMDVPVNGMSMSEVESRYGNAKQRDAAVGQPPITRWVYDRWSVFFEYDRVLYTVLHEGEVIEAGNSAGFEGDADPVEDDSTDSG